jgi:putative transposase
VREFSATELPVARLVGWIGIARGKYFDWRGRYGKANEHNGLVPRDHWIEEWTTSARCWMGRAERSCTGSCVSR